MAYDSWPLFMPVGSTTRAYAMSICATDGFPLRQRADFWTEKPAWSSATASAHAMASPMDRPVYSVRCHCSPSVTRHTSYMTLSAEGQTNTRVAALHS